MPSMDPERLMTDDLTPKGIGKITSACLKGLGIDNRWEVTEENDKTSVIKWFFDSEDILVFATYSVQPKEKMTIRQVMEHVLSVRDEELKNKEM